MAMEIGCDFLEWIKGRRSQGERGGVLLEPVGPRRRTIDCVSDQPMLDCAHPALRGISRAAMKMEYLSRASEWTMEQRAKEPTGACHGIGRRTLVVGLAVMALARPAGAEETIPAWAGGD